MEFSSLKASLLNYAGQIALIPDYKCILDIQPPINLDNNEFMVFTIRGLQKEEHPWAYYVHCNSKDTVLAKWISLLMYNVAFYLKDTQSSL